MRYREDTCKGNCLEKASKYDSTSGYSQGFRSDNHLLALMNIRRKDIRAIDTPLGVVTCIEVTERKECRTF